MHWDLQPDNVQKLVHAWTKRAGIAERKADNDNLLVQHGEIERLREELLPKGSG